jgi:hypothetical protein
MAVRCFRMANLIKLGLQNTGSIHVWKAILGAKRLFSNRSRSLTVRRGVLTGGWTCLGGLVAMEPSKRDTPAADLLRNCSTRDM